ncbi:TetR/AcrR family transcriptional regulator [Burkholderia ubonensis]|uniref:TetR family transcriptional regulator n=1 Tax=Burkholderia ubonensis TaxID=101571 RepID=A0A119J2J4_9BURK|nr:TetR/AcrR family transcriptional regulator [Burkholderia ubonensis]AJX12925.1 bacterial regulatory s, tetR family protein [Burkholderia ubonensis MSMB22]KVD20860.1 TetR family transcriptional regulator [Burkholderia ubonensis]KVD53068.1 TetR family transcriptional regulator [Burkholderia ubonensis]KVD53764.1 TetR family transcriptional regulator [Burkholderia ubonensis]KVD85005.1 TetR family transcriptional regulator [Burkholderia ubonensis]
MSNSGMEKVLKTQKRGRAYGGVAPEVRAAERRDALIRAATRVFGTVGFRKATVRSICREAKLNDRYFYAAFDSTEDLLRCTYLHHAEQLRDAVAQAVAARGGDLDARVDAGLAAFFGFLRDPCAARVLLLEVMGVSLDTDATYQRVLVEFGKLIMAIGGRGEAVAGPERTEQWLIGLALVGAMTNVGTAWLLTEYRDPEAQMIASCRKVLLGTLAAAG